VHGEKQFPISTENPQRTCLYEFKIPCSFNIDVAITIIINSRQP